MYTTQTPTARDMMARVAAAGRIEAERKARESRAAAESAQWRRDFEQALAEGQSLGLNGEVEWCHVCSRATDHWGEHTPEQIAAWRERSRGLFV